MRSMYVTLLDVAARAYRGSSVYPSARAETRALVSLAYVPAWKVPGGHSRDIETTTTGAWLRMTVSVRGEREKIVILDRAGAAALGKTLSDWAETPKTNAGAMSHVEKARTWLREHTP